MKHFLSIRDLAREDLPRLFALMAELKSKTKARDRSTPLPGRTMALIFEKPSLRTRVTFEVAMTQLGGAAVYLAAQEIGMGKRESVPDVARNLSRWVDVVAARVSVAARLEHLRTLLRRGSFDFEEAVRGADRVTVATTLFALLELYKQGEASWAQSKPFGDILVSARADAAPARRRAAG